MANNVRDSIVTIQGSNFPTLPTAEFLAFYEFNVREALLYARCEFFFPFLSRGWRVRLFRRAFLYLSAVISANIIDRVFLVLRYYNVDPIYVSMVVKGSVVV